MKKELVALLDGQIVGRIMRDERGRLTFVYSDPWRGSNDAYPLSLSMPLALTQHGNDRIEPYLWGLLPDNPMVLDFWARKFHVSPRNAFGLIGAVGEDCAGAGQFVLPARLDAVIERHPGEIEWLDEAGLAQRLRTLREDHSAWRIPHDTGQFSLAGAQPKTALMLDKGKWGVPSGRIPTTHILKPPTGQFDGYAENEHFCLELARALGLPAVDSKIIHFQDEIAIVVTRYDRIRIQGNLRRVHQEDVCQALAINPARKYQNEGGPGIAKIADLLRTYSGRPKEDMETLVDSIIYNWLIVGTDAHAKNYALLIGRGGSVRLAPLYDLASALPYSQIDLRRAKMSMKIGGEYLFQNISQHHWQKMSQEIRLDAGRVTERLHSISETLPDHIADIEKRMKADGIDHPLIHRLAEKLISRARTFRKSFK
jgi:serine/threonine-protein kinase HipA